MPPGRVRYRLEFAVTCFRCRQAVELLLLAGGVHGCVVRGGGPTLEDITGLAGQCVTDGELAARLAGVLGSQVVIAIGDGDVLAVAGVDDVDVV